MVTMALAASGKVGSVKFDVFLLTLNSMAGAFMDVIVDALMVM